MASARRGRCGGGRGLRFGEERVIQLRINDNLFDRDLLDGDWSVTETCGGLRNGKPLGVEHVRNLQSIHVAVVAVIDFDGMCGAVEATRLAFELHLEKGL